MASAMPKSRSGTQTRQRCNRRTGHFNDNENALFDEAFARYRQSVAASRYGESESAFIRWATIGAGAKKMPRRRPYRRPAVNLNPSLVNILLAKFGAIETNLAKIGGHTNQIAYVHNCRQTPNPDFVRVWTDELKQACSAICDIKKAVGFE